MKRCKKCGEMKPLAEFVKDKRQKDGTLNVCNACQRARQRAWEYERYHADAEWRERRLKASRERRRKKYQEDPEYKAFILKRMAEWRADPKNAISKSIRDKEYREANKEKIAAVNKEWRNSPKGKFSQVMRNMRVNYGITDIDLMEMLNEQKGCCKICEADFGTIKTRKNARTPYVVDHCHKTGKVRGLLCQRCNLTVAFYENEVRKYFKKLKKYVPDVKLCDEKLEE